MKQNPTETPPNQYPASYEAIATYFPNVMIAVVDTDNHIVFIDGEELAKLGLHRKNLEGKPVQSVKYFSAQWKNRMVEYARKTRRGADRPAETRQNGESFSYEIRFKDQMYRVNTMPLREKKSTNQILFVFTNITEQKRTEMEMLNSIKKERELGELKSRFVSMASHEFRTPLSTILSSANLIARQNEAGKESERIKNVERIRSSVKNLVDILNEFLSLGRLEEGKVSVNKEAFDLVKFMEAIVQELQHAHKPGQQVHISSPLPAIQVNLDKQFVRNIFLNLLSNALKYSPEGKLVEIAIALQLTTFSVKIVDQGVGIPEDEHKHLFDLFFRARNATNIQGTGLGLPIVKKYIDLMHGEIAVKSQVEKGTTFTVTLPLEQVNLETV
ncbi:MAG: HAMP domain-containing sensor histidine kinase [Cyclobacteriaceae bacterium]